MPRVTVTLSDDVAGAIARLSDAQGMSRAAVVRDLLESFAPVMVRIAMFVEASNKAQAETLKAAAKEAAFIQSKLEDALVYAPDEHGTLTALLREFWEAGKAADAAAAGCHAKGARREPQPPLTNRGVG